MADMLPLGDTHSGDQRTVFDALRECDCMTEDPGDGYGERVVTHSGTCRLHPEYDGPL